MGSMMDLLMSAEDKEILKRVQLATLESIEIQKRTEKITEETLKVTRDYVEIWRECQQALRQIARAVEILADNSSKAALDR